MKPQTTSKLEDSVKDLTEESIKLVHEEATKLVAVMAKENDLLDSEDILSLKKALVLSWEVIQALTEKSEQVVSESFLLGYGGLCVTLELQDNQSDADATFAIMAQKIVNLMQVPSDT